MDTNVIVGIIAEQLGLEPEELTPETTFEELGADSLDLFHIVNALEEEYDIEFDNDEAEQIKTVGDAIAYIRSVVD